MTNNTPAPADLVGAVAKAIRRAKLGCLSDAALAERIVHYSWEECVTEAQAAITAMQAYMASELAKPMDLHIALDFADNPRPYHTLQAPADTNGELYRALVVLADAYRRAAAITPQPAVRIEPAKPIGATCPACDGDGFGNVGCAVCGVAGRLFTLGIVTHQPDQRDAEIERLREALRKIERRTEHHPDDEAGDDKRDKHLANQIARAALAKSEGQ